MPPVKSITDTIPAHDASEILSEPIGRDSSSAPSISSPRVSHASLIPSPGNETAPPTRGIWGQPSSEQFGEFDPGSRSLRTFQLCLFPTEGDILTAFCRDWPRAGMMRSGRLFRLETLELPTSVRGSGRWPIPKASPSGPDYARGLRKRSGGDDLATAVARGFIPTPSAMDSRRGDYTCDHGKAERRRPSLLGVAKMLPTPKSRDWKGQTQRGIHAQGDALPNIDRGDGRPIGGALNPTWVEWLMGFPVGWTGSVVSETPSSPKLPQPSSKK